VNEHLRTFAAKAGLGDALFLNEDGTCGIALGDPETAVEVGLEVIEDEGLILFHAKLGDLEPDISVEGLMRLLALNVYGVETGGGTIGVDEETREIVLTFGWPFEDMGYPHFEGALERLYAVASYLRGQLAAALAQAEQPEAGGVPPSGAIWG
jgi:hypothetical protein